MIWSWPISQKPSFRSLGEATVALCWLSINLAWSSERIFCNSAEHCQQAARLSKEGLAPWQKRRALEILHENMRGRIRLSDTARECRLSVSQFARSFKSSFGASTHQRLIQHRIDHANN
jgi:transcriptional regulator GlxA family with amidase domain